MVLPNYNNATEGDTAPFSASPLTVPHVIAGDSRILLMGVTTWNFGLDTATVTATYNGTAMTEIYTEAQDQHRFTILGLIAPDLGNNDIVITPSASTQISMGAASYTEASQTGLPTPFFAKGGDNSPTVTLTGQANKLVVSMLGYFTSPFDPTTALPQGGMTERVENFNGPLPGDSVAIADIEGTDPITTNWTITGVGATWRIVSMGLAAEGKTVRIGNVTAKRSNVTSVLGKKQSTEQTFVRGKGSSTTSTVAKGTTLTGVVGKASSTTSVVGDN